MTGSLSRMRVHAPGISSGRSMSASSRTPARTSTAPASSALPPRSPSPACNWSNRDRANKAGGIAASSFVDATMGEWTGSKRANNSFRWPSVTKGMSARQISAAACGPRAASATPHASDRDMPSSSLGFATISKPCAANRCASGPWSSGQTAIRRPGIISVIRAAAWNASGSPAIGASSLSSPPKRRDRPAASRIAQMSPASIIAPSSPSNVRASMNAMPS